MQSCSAESQLQRFALPRISAEAQTAISECWRTVTGQALMPLLASWPRLLFVVLGDGVCVEEPTLTLTRVSTAGAARGSGASQSVTPAAPHAVPGSSHAGALPAPEPYELCHSGSLCALPSVPEPAFPLSYLSLWEREEALRADLLFVCGVR